MTQKIATLVLACLMVMSVGCSNNSDKGKNKDKDVPKAASVSGS